VDRGALGPWTGAASCPSFIPPRAQRELRDLTRYRTTFVRERVNLVNRVHKALESANLKLASVATDIMGVSGRAILSALLAGEADPAVLADLAKGPLRKKRPQLEQALRGQLQYGERHNEELDNSGPPYDDTADDADAQLDSAVISYEDVLLVRQVETTAPQMWDRLKRQAQPGLRRNTKSHLGSIRPVWQITEYTDRQPHIVLNLGASSALLSRLEEELPLLREVARTNGIPLTMGSIQVTKSM
jgi:hypothetical protein